MNKNLELKLIEIFCNCDDFCKNFEGEIESRLIPSTANSFKPKVPCGLALSEMMAIEMFYHLQGSKCFKYYYNYFVEAHLKEYFPGMPSYNRFVQLKPRLVLYLFCFILACRLGARTGTYYVDSSKLAVCHNLRIRSHRVFTGLAKRGKTSTGWFFGLKLHLITNQLGEIVSFFITPGNVADNNLTLGVKLCKGLCGKLFGDKGYISEKLNQALAGQELFLITKVKKNMKNKFMLLEDKVWLKSRGMIESVIDLLKHICDIEHSRHRSPINAMVNLLGGLSAYSFLDQKPSVKNRNKRFRDYLSLNNLPMVA